MQKLLLILLCIIPSALPAQSPNALIKDGYKLYAKGEFEKAYDKFSSASKQDPDNFKAYFNMGDSFYELDSADVAETHFQSALYRAELKEDRAKIHHNLGNIYFDKKDYEKSVESYKQSLLNNPYDEETRYNLAYALQMMKEQENKQGKDKNDQEKKDQEKQENKDKEKQQDPNKKDQQEKQDQQQQSEPQKAEISEKQAERILKALENEEKEVQEKVNKKKYKVDTRKKDKDW